MNDDAAHATRFIGLAPVGDASKQKFIHAISPTPASTMSSTERYLPNHQTPPYLHIHKQNQKKNLLKVFLIHSIGNMMSQKDKNLEVVRVISRVSNSFFLVLVHVATCVTFAMIWKQGNNP